ncbi:MAG TPA: SGNH/GDSL hydrolase family protein [Sphingomonas sp.]|nr:SGNH/GDSL hydrolase family protein [Sphingomonas sp.]
MRMTAKLILGALALIVAGQASAQERWAGAWGYATSPATRAVRGTLPAGTYRFRFRLSQTGDAIRLVFTNPEGAVPLRIASASIARAAKAFGIDPGTERPVRFESGAGVSITGGATLTSTPIDLPAKSGEDVVVTVVTSAESSTVAGNAAFPAAFAEGLVDAAGTGFAAQKIRPFVTQIAARNPSADCTIVTFGDSITEGARGTRPDWRGWPGTLAKRLNEGGKPHCGVVNMGISGNRLLRDGRGTAGIDRFERDVASVAGVTHLILLEGINDIWKASAEGEPPVTAADLIAGYRKLIDAGHARGIRVIGGTLTPGWGSKYITPGMEGLRQEVNRWIRTSGAFDAVIDFEAALRDTSSPVMIKPPFDSGDKLHPGDNGYEAMGRAVPLALFATR